MSAITWAGDFVLELTPDGVALKCPHCAAVLHLDERTTIGGAVGEANDHWYDHTPFALYPDADDQ